MGPSELGAAAINLFIFSGIFRDLRNLSSLGLQNNRLTGLPQGIFDSLVSLETIGRPRIVLQKNVMKNLKRLFIDRLKKRHGICLENLLLDSLYVLDASYI